MSCKSSSPQFEKQRNQTEFNVIRNWEFLWIFGRSIDGQISTNLSSFTKQKSVVQLPWNVLQKFVLNLKHNATKRNSSWNHNWITAESSLWPVSLWQIYRWPSSLADRHTAISQRIRFTNKIQIYWYHRIFAKVRPQFETTQPCEIPRGTPIESQMTVPVDTSLELWVFGRSIGGYEGDPIST